MNSNKSSIPINPVMPQSRNKGKAIQIIGLKKEENSNRFYLNEEVLKSILEDVGDRQIAIQAIAGPTRTGKSFLLSFMLKYLNANGDIDWIGFKDKDKPLEGFNWRSGDDAETLGIWMWSKPYIIKKSTGEEVAILLVDTQGIFDKTMTKRDCATIVGLCLLTCSTTIFNLKTNLLADNLEVFDAFMTFGLSALNLENSQKQKDTPFQKLIFLIRDFDNPLEFTYGLKGGQKFLEKRLQLTDDMSEETKMTGKHIKECFAEIQCFLMPFIGTNAINEEYNGNLNQPDTNFIKKLEEFISHLLNANSIVPKSIAGVPIKGRDLIVYLNSYINIFNSDKMPDTMCIMDATAEAIYSNACREALEIYFKSMIDMMQKSEYLSESIINETHSSALNQAVLHLVNKPKIGRSHIFDKIMALLKNDIESEFKRRYEIINIKNERFLESAYSKCKSEFENKVKTTFNETDSLQSNKLQELQKTIKTETFETFNYLFSEVENEKLSHYNEKLNKDIESQFKDIENKYDIMFQKSDQQCVTALEKSLNRYKSKVTKKLVKSTFFEDNILVDLHSKYEEEAVDLFSVIIDSVPKSFSQKYENNLKEKINELFKEYKEINSYAKEKNTSEGENALKSGLDIYESNMRQLFEKQFITKEEYEKSNKEFKSKAQNHFESLLKEIKGENLIKSLKSGFETGLNTLMTKFDEVYHQMIDKLRDQMDKALDDCLKLHNERMNEEINTRDGICDEELIEINEIVLKEIRLDFETSNDFLNEYKNEYVPQLKKRLFHNFQQLKAKNEKKREHIIQNENQMISSSVKLYIEKMLTFYDNMDKENFDKEKNFKQIHESIKNETIDSFKTENTIENDETFKRLRDQLIQEIDRESNQALIVFEMQANNENKYIQALEKAKKVYINEMDKHFSNNKFIRPSDLVKYHSESESIANIKLQEFSPFNKVKNEIKNKFNEAIAVIYGQYKKINLANLPINQAIGIDLGTTYSCVGVVHKNKVILIPNPESGNTTPSYVEYTERGEVKVGAKEESHINPSNTIYDSKRMIGNKFGDKNIQKDIKSWPFKVIEESGLLKIELREKSEKVQRTLYPEEISAQILKKLKSDAENYLDYKIDRAVITVPAYFNDAQRQATKDAAKIAGLNVLQILNEPTAAAIAYYHQMKDDAKKNILVYDLGGGTFDVAVAEINKGFTAIKAIAGDTHLGGEDFDNRIFDLCMKKFEKKLKKKVKLSQRELSTAKARLKIQCEKCKWKLSSNESAVISIPQIIPDLDFLYTMSRSEFETLNMDYFKKTFNLLEKVLKDAKLNKSDIDDIVLIGGSSKIPKIQQMLREFFNQKALNKYINLDEAVAYGAAIQASLNNGEDLIHSNHSGVQDLSPISIGIEMIDKSFKVVIPKNTELPTTVTQTFCTSSDFIQYIDIRIFEGEHEIAIKNRLLGAFRITGIPSKPKGKETIELTMNIDSEGILNVRAVSNTKSNIKASIAIDDHRGRIPAEELKILIDQANS